MMSLSQPPIPSLSLDGFRDGASHWRKIKKDRVILPTSPDQPAYAPTQVREIALNILLFQRESGGWPCDFDMAAILTDTQKQAVIATQRRTDTSFDNHNIHSQLDYLARAAALLGESPWHEAIRRGLDFVFSAELPVGGFPQSWPEPKGYFAHITFNDGVTIGNLNLLKDIAESQPHWAWLDTTRRDKARKAVARGVTCILKCQIKQTGWCQQHDEKTFEATTARTFELASICPQDTVEILRFLMRFEKPGISMAMAITNGAAWLTRVKLSGIRVEKIKAPLEKFEFHDTDTDVIVVQDPTAPPLWARHYEIGTNRPIFSGRDAVKRYALAEIERERRTGTPWYGTWPAIFLKKDYPEWQKRPRV